MASQFQVTIPIFFFEELKSSFKEGEEKTILDSIMKEYSWRYSQKTFLSIDIETLTEKILDKLLEFGREIKGIPGNKKLINEIEGWRKIQQNPEGAIVTDLQVLKHALDKYIETTQEHYLFYKDSLTGNMLPYIAIKSVYTPPVDKGEDYTPALTRLYLLAVSLTQKKDKTITFYSSDIRGQGGQSVRSLLERKEYFLENKDLLDTYKEELQIFFDYKERIGHQFIGEGMGVENSGYWSNKLTSLEKDGVPYKLVVDVIEGEEKIYTETSPIKFKGKRENQNDEEGKGSSIMLPIHPYLKVFNLQTHNFLIVHVNNVTPYIYDIKMGEKLILPEDHKNLIDILARGLGEDMSDIIKGKTGGIIVISTGPPGTGKTLTAEVYSEVVERPLYVVQASQLGIDLGHLEKKLIEVLDRATRWHAILLIDEADVYIHERGSDIQQNAIVGIFLRVLEYYRGVLFMTSNRGEIIDDAIMSRKTAHIEYVMPDEVEQIRIWEVLSKEFKVDISKKLISDLVKTFPNLSGRDIKSHIKLGKLLSLKMNKLIDLSLFQYIHKYLVVDKVSKN